MDDTEFVEIIHQEKEKIKESGLIDREDLRNELATIQQETDKNNLAKSLIHVNEEQNRPRIIS